MKTIIVIGALLLLAGCAMTAKQIPASEGGVFTGMILSEECSRRGMSDLASVSDAEHCLGYIAGVLDMDGINMLRKEKHLCLPPEVTTGQAVKVFQKYMSDHPEKLHVPAIALILISLEEAFPCNPNGKDSVKIFMK